MSTAAPPQRLWVCPSCGRRVPLRAPVCHCGTTRERALELAGARPADVPAARAQPRGTSVLATMPRDVRLLLGGAVLLVAVGLGWALIGPPPRDTTPPVLGWIDPGPPDPATLVAKKARPPFKLPWWK